VEAPVPRFGACAGSGTSASTDDRCQVWKHDVVSVTASRLVTLAASAVVAAGVATGVVERSYQLLAVSAAGVVAVVVGWVVVAHDARSPVGPAVAWSGAAVAAVSLDGSVGDLPWSTGLWPLNLAGAFALLLVFPDGPRKGRLWHAVPWAFGSAALGLQVALWGATQDGGRVTGNEPAPWRLGVGYLSMVVLAAAVILAVASLVIHYRAGPRRTRQQIRWLLLAGIGVVILLIGGWVAEAFGASIDLAYTPFLAAILTLVPASVGIAIVRHDLFDVDRMLSETTAWIVTIALSAGLFAIVVVLIGQAISVGGGSTSAAAAFVTALLFLPMQRRVASRVGRVVDRDRFQAVATIERFAADVWSGRRQPEEIEAVLQEVQDDPELVVQVRTASGWARLDGTAVTDPVGLALEAGGEVVAMIRLGWDSRRARRRVADVARTAWVPIEVSRLRVDLRDALDQAQESRKRSTLAAAEERRRLERDLHDRAQQRIVASAVSLRLLQERLPEPEASELETTVQELRATVEELRRIAHGVRPTQLDDGLKSALANVRETCPLPLELDVDPLLEVSDARALTAYLVVTEAVVNVLKHADASCVRVRISTRCEHLRVEVADDGIGGVPPDAPLLALRDRVLSAGGTLAVESPPGAGTSIVALI
jgi:signal transduction histidine kinase